MLKSLTWTVYSVPLYLWTWAYDWGKELNQDQWAEWAGQRTRVLVRLGWATHRVSRFLPVIPELFGEELHYMHVVPLHYKSKNPL